MTAPIFDAEFIAHAPADIAALLDALAAAQARAERAERALEDVRRIASHGDVNVQPLLVPILDIARAALESS
jgi:uncharacterized protein with von Willebrand factor type A (vWA) domain